VKNKAELRYNTKVKEIHKDHVVLQDGSIVKAKHVVCCCGPKSKQFDKENQSKIEVREIEYHVFNDVSGFPSAFTEFLPDQTHHFGLYQWNSFNEYKVASDEPWNFEHFVEYLKTWFASKFKSIIYTHVCFYTMTDDGDFMYSTGKNGVHYCYGFNGQGFKFMPMHGKIVLRELIEKKEARYSKWLEAKL
jgi:glycine/D-amino acid oxidase-like deaminating enzyme